MKKIYLFFLICLLFLTACQPVAPKPDNQPANGNTGIANPASVNCEQKGGTLEMRENEAGQYGVCKFTDGSECEEWAFFRGECTPGNTKPTQTSEIKNFDDCVKAGNPVMESYPRQCRANNQTFTEVIDDTTTPPPSTEPTAACTKDYIPVCALIQVQCFRAPCPPLFETIDNECLAKERGNMLLGYTSGQCEKKLDTTCKTDADCLLPGDYAAMSRCPFQAKCVADSCVVVCPASFAVK